ncbi:putative Anti-sigma factor antagonist [Gammaproteobacteria bacterium]
MSMTSVEQREQNKVLVVCPDRYLTVNQVWPIYSQIEKSEGIRYQRIVLNLKEIKYVDSSGLGLLLTFLKQLETRGCQLVLCECSSYLLDLMHKLRFDALFKIYAKEENACQLEG